MSNLRLKEINESLAGGYTSEAFQKEGKNMTVVAMFSGITGGATVKLQQSVEGRVFQDIPKSAVTLEAGQGEQMWNDGILPEGTFVRIVVGQSAGELSTIKILS
jgi:hypothetical protein